MHIVSGAIYSANQKHKRDYKTWLILPLVHGRYFCYNIWNIFFIILTPKPDMPAALQAQQLQTLAMFASQSAESVVTAWESSRKGLTKNEADRRIQLFGPNTLARERKAGWLFELLSNFKNPLVIVLLFASLLSFGAGQYVDASLVLGIVFMSVSLNFFQEHRANKAAEKLKARVATTATVLRDGKKVELPILDLVPGDIVLLSAGDLAPADMRVLESKDFFVNQSSLTGESFPAEKSADPVEKAEEITALHNIVFLGTNVISGSAMAVVLKTGSHTEFGKIAKKLVGESPDNDFTKGIKHFSVLILRTTICFVLFIFLFNALDKKDILQSFLFAVAVAVGLTPELLPMIMSITMASGSIKMAKHGVIVKKLTAIPSFGSMDILCTDKTGTLTEDKITLIKYEDTAGRMSDDVLLHAYLNSSHQTGIRNPLDDAVIGFRPVDISAYTKVDEIPFDFFRKKMSVVVEQNGRHVLITKGAPEEVFKSCSCYCKENACIAMDKKVLQELSDHYHELSRQGFRVLAIATKEMPEHQKKYSKADETDLQLVGFVAFLDPAKKDVSKVLQQLEQLGIDIKIITGDNEFVTRKICEEVGLPIKGVLLGQDIDALTDDALRIVVERTTIFARFSPDEKNRIINALRLNGHVVGYMGDGINDAPSLKAADVGISVSNGVDVAKESADMVLTHKGLRELVDGVMEGRKTFGNTMKYVMMGISSNFGNMFSVLGAVLFLPYLPMLPVQILLNNFLYDLSQITIPSDSVDPDYISRPRKWDIRFIRNFMFTFGPVSSAFDFLTFYVLYTAFPAAPAAFRTGWFLESLATQTLVIHIIRTQHMPFVDSRPSKRLLLSTVAIVGIGWLLPYSPIAGYLQMVPLPPSILGMLAGIVVCYLAVTEMAKRWFYKKHTYSM
ncbi:MAG: magnesium-translocating P-type ATPase [Candidatus Peribacteria bacterium]|nr:magnesium-translocating P-type ATPase [Candidatus Peribacteria bacterium]